MNAVSLPVGASDAQLAASRSSLWRKLVREPLLHFVLVGAAIFVVAHLVETAERETQATIVIDDGLRQRLAGLYRTQFGVAATPAQLQTIVDSYIDDELLYREALRLGLEGDDEIIRRRLIQKLEFLQQDSAAQSEPTPAQLRAYYEANREQFLSGARVTFTHVYFNPDRDGDAQALERAKRARADLLAHGGSSAGDTFPLDSDYTALARDEATRLFGASNFIDALYTSPVSDWSQPVRSGFGWHLFKVTDVQTPRPASFDAVVPQVRAAYLQAGAARARREQLDALRAQYRVTSVDAAP